MTFKKIPFCKNQIFFLWLPISWSLAIWFVRCTCVDDRKINCHSTRKFLRKWMTYCLSSSRKSTNKFFLMDTFSEFGNWVPWKREKWHNWKAALQVEMSPPKRKCEEQGMIVFTWSPYFFSISNGVNVIMWPFNVTYSCTE